MSGQRLCHRAKKHVCFAFSTCFCISNTLLPFLNKSTSCTLLGLVTKALNESAKGHSSKKQIYQLFLSTDSFNNKFYYIICFQVHATSCRQTMAKLEVASVFWEDTLYGSLFNLRISTSNSKELLEIFWPRPSSFKWENSITSQILNRQWLRELYLWTVFSIVSQDLWVVVIEVNNVKTGWRETGSATLRKRVCS